MITLNGKQFAETDAEMVESLFHPGGTCAGFAKRSVSGVAILDLQKNRVGVINHHGVLCCATPVKDITKNQTDKGYWYSFAPVELVGKYDSYMREREETRAALKHFEIVITD